MVGPGGGLRGLASRGCARPRAEGGASEEAAHVLGTVQHSLEQRSEAHVLLPRAPQVLAEAQQCPGHSQQDQSYQNAQGHVVAAAGGRERRRGSAPGGGGPRLGRWEGASAGAAAS